jgi:LytR cell envelope-related transcriptional attenuator
VEHAQPLNTPFPWRATTVVAGALALTELVALIAIGFAHFAPSAPATTSKRTPHAAAVTATAAVKVKPMPQIPLRPRSAVRVLVLNGNGVSGAAASEAARLQGAGYRIGGATNAQRHDYAGSMVMYVPGWAKEARRLARETGIRIVAPVDGLRAAQLKGSKVVLLLGT